MASVLPVGSTEGGLGWIEPICGCAFGRMHGRPLLSRYASTSASSAPRSGVGAAAAPAEVEAHAGELGAFVVHVAEPVSVASDGGSRALGPVPSRTQRRTWSRVGGRSSPCGGAVRGAMVRALALFSVGFRFILACAGTTVVGAVDRGGLIRDAGRAVGSRSARWDSCSQRRGSSATPSGSVYSTGGTCFRPRPELRLGLQGGVPPGSEAKLAAARRFGAVARRFGAAARRFGAAARRFGAAARRFGAAARRFGAAARRFGAAARRFGAAARRFGAAARRFGAAARRFGAAARRFGAAARRFGAAARRFGAAARRFGAAARRFGAAARRFGAAARRFGAAARRFGAAARRFGAAARRFGAAARRFGAAARRFGAAARRFGAAARRWFLFSRGVPGTLRPAIELRLAGFTALS
ncbi:hypothetical protein BE15_23435 [Sorangium cellulosum]|uniref:Uncharacterized protein n=1 Tax=Sorangium cellulosum TaxID=56 RepID=A0A150QD60_SORCE|nr:hypothetical protein BE15_23435 [Sorangium cellulosum]